MTILYNLKTANCWNGGGSRGEGRRLILFSWLFIGLIDRIKVLLLLPESLELLLTASCLLLFQAIHKGSSRD